MHLNIGMTPIIDSYKRVGKKKEKRKKAFRGLISIICAPIVCETNPFNLPGITTVSNPVRDRVVSNDLLSFPSSM